jgi:hypothetical protein
MKSAAVGFRPHSGWTSLVVVALEDGKPIVLLRERVHLVKTFNYSFRQPYHTAARAPLDEGRAFIARVQTEARGLAYRALRGVQAKLAGAEYRLVYSGHLEGSARVLPSLEKILAAHPLIHTAEGQFFREVVSHASHKVGLKEVRVKEKELLRRGSEAFRRSQEKLQEQLTALGKPMGSPWSQDEKFATLVAWLALASKAFEKRTREAGKGRQAI